MNSGTAATLVPLPGGTLNHFAKDVGVAQTTLRKTFARISGQKTHNYHTKSAISVSHDGEVSNMMTPITYKVEQKTLRVLG